MRFPVVRNAKTAIAWRCAAAREMVMMETALCQNTSKSKRNDFQETKTKHRMYTTVNNTKNIPNAVFGRWKCEYSASFLAKPQSAVSIISISLATSRNIASAVFAFPTCVCIRKHCFVFVS